MVTMDRQDYINKANHLLNQNTYRSIAKDPTNSIKNKLINILKIVKSQTGLDSNTYKSMYPTGCVPPKFYDLPKIHKPDTPLRPIVSSCGSVTYGVGKELAKILKPLVGKSPHHITSTQDCGTSQTNQLEPGECLSSYDVSALFTSVPIDPALTIIKIFWKRTPPSRKELLWKLVTLSSYWSFFSRTPTFLSKTSSMNRLRVLPWVPQSALLWPISTWST